MYKKKRSTAERISKLFLESELTEPFFDLIFQMSKEVLGADACAVHLFNEKEQILELEYQSEQDFLPFGLKLGPGEGPPGVVLQTHEPLGFEHWSGRAEYSPTAHPRESILSIPLTTSNGIIGVLTFSYRHEVKHFGDADRTTAKSFEKMTAVMLNALAESWELEIDEISNSREEKLAAFHRLEGMLKTGTPSPSDEELKEDYVNYLSEKYS